MLFSSHATETPGSEISEVSIISFAENILSKYFNLHFILGFDQNLFRRLWKVTTLTNTSQIIAGHCCAFRASTIKWSRNIVAMMATATIVGWTFVNIYEKYVNVKLKLN